MKYTPTTMQALTACAGLLGSLVASGAHAQAAPPSSVTLYGLIDAGVEYVNKVDGKGSLQVRNIHGSRLVQHRVDQRQPPDMRRTSCNQGTKLALRNIRKVSIDVVPSLCRFRGEFHEPTSPRPRERNRDFAR